jgi:hypothetical protein
LGNFCHCFIDERVQKRLTTRRNERPYHMLVPISAPMAAVAKFGSLTPKGGHVLSANCADPSCLGPTHCCSIGVPKRA